jgi:hypothetical protein
MCICEVPRTTSTSARLVLRGLLSELTKPQPQKSNDRGFLGAHESARAARRGHPGEGERGVVHPPLPVVSSVTFIMRAETNMTDMPRHGVLTNGHPKLYPDLHHLDGRDPQRRSGDEMALNIEGIVNCTAC